MRILNNSKRDLGPAISYEDVMSLMTVIFVVFFIIMVPLINIDKVRTEKAKIDTFWKSHAGELLQKAPRPNAGQSYASAFGLSGKLVFISNPGPKLRYIEAVSTNSNIDVIAHDHSKNTFISMHVQPGSGITIFKEGRILWNARDREWYTENEKISYGKEEASKQMEKNYRAWASRTHQTPAFRDLK